MHICKQLLKQAFNIRITCIFVANEEKKEEKKRMTMLQGNIINDIEMQDTSMSPSGGASESYNDQHVCYNL